MFDLTDYSREILAFGGGMDLYLRVLPGADLEGLFKAWDADEQEFIYVKGWLWEIQDYPHD